MPHEYRRHRRVRHNGEESPAIDRALNHVVAPTPGTLPPEHRTSGAAVAPYRRFSVPPEELGIIGAELTRRLTFAAEEFLTELAEGQVRDSFRQELTEILHFDE